LSGKLTDFDLMNLKLNDQEGFSYVIMFCIINGELSMNKITKEKMSIIKYHEVKRHGYSPLCLVRSLPYYDMNLVAVSDFDCNIHIIDLRNTCLEPVSKLNPCFTIYASHSRLVSDIKFITIPLPEQNGNRAMNYIATCGFDGYFKIWDL
jgi:WD40 repeat protein